MTHPRSFLVVVHPFPPTPSSGANRWGGMVKYLRRAGHDVRVVTSGAFGPLAEPAAEQGVLRTGDLMASAGLRRLAGLPPLALPDARGAEAGRTRPDEPVSSGSDLPAPLTHVLVPDAFLVSWAPMALRAAWSTLAERPADCVITSSPNESTHLIGAVLRRRFGAAWLADLRDGWTFQRFLPDFPTRPQRALNRALERRALRGADVVTAATRPIADDLSARLGVGCAHVPNAWDPDLETDLASGPEPGNGEVRLVHTGRISGGWGRDPGPLFAALRRLLDTEPALEERVRLVMAGGLDDRDRRAIAEARLDGVVADLGSLPRAEALRQQRQAHALLLVTSSHSGEATGKLFEYLAAGRPIVALAAANEAARIVSETGTGVAVDPTDAAGLDAALRRAVDGTLPFSPRNLSAYRFPGPALRVAELAETVIAGRGGGGH